MPARKALTPLLIFLFSLMPVTAQEKGGKATVYGSIVSEKSKLPIRGAHVLLVTLRGNKADSLYRVSTKEGLFTYKDLEPGKVYMKVTSMGTILRRVFSSLAREKMPCFSQ